MSAVEMSHREPRRKEILWRENTIGCHCTFDDWSYNDQKIFLWKISLVGKGSGKRAPPAELMSRVC